MEEQHGIPLFWIGIGIFSILGLTLYFIGIHGITHYIDYVLLIISSIILLRFLYKLIIKRQVTVDLLMSIAGIATWYIDAIMEGFLVFTLYSLSEMIEHYAERYAMKKLTGLIELLPSKVRKLVDNKVEEVDLDRVDIGDTILIVRGEVVPVDGVLLEDGTFDTSYITGEPYPFNLKRGDYVESGYINIGKVVRIRALKKPSDSMLQLLVREAEKALERKASIQRFIERFSNPYTFIVLILFGLALLFVEPYRALAILLAGCPSAFILSSATATSLSIALLARTSVIVRGGIVLERLKSVKTIVVDKTGTLTLGKLKVSKVVPLGRFNEKMILEIAGSAAKASNHPLSRAIATYGSYTPSYAEEYPGRGVKALVNGYNVVIGSKDFIGYRNNNDLCIAGERSVYVSINDGPAGAICLVEEVDEGIKRVIGDLVNRGYKIIIASGDSIERVKAIAEYLGINEYHASLKPSDKKKLVYELRKQYGLVAMVGDGVNDVEALASADVGIAVGSLSVVANISDIVLTRGLYRLPLVMGFSKRYYKSLILAIALALIIKLGVMIAGLMGLLPLWAIVGIGDDGSTLLSFILITSLVLGYFRKS